MYQKEVQTHHGASYNTRPPSWFLAQSPTRRTSCKNHILGMHFHSPRIPGFGSQIIGAVKPSYLMFIGDLYSPLRDIQCYCEAIMLFKPSCLPPFGKTLQ